MSPQVRATPAKRRQSSKQPAPLPPATSRAGLSAPRALAIPLTFTLLLAALGMAPSIREVPTLRWSFWGAAAVLLAWNAGLLVTSGRRRRLLSVEVSLRKQHYLQACAHLSILLYWGAYWERVHDAALLIAAQLVFAYAFDALLSWSRRDTYTLGFGPFPIIFSTNLFLWFKPDWFYLQFLMVAVGFAAKELIRWEKDGRRVHIFNPSSLTLSLFSVILILTGTTDVTWGREIANTQLNPPHMYLLIVLVSLPAQLLFGVASMTLSAVVTTVVFGLAYSAATGAHFFLQPFIPIAVFLGMHLLFTDPSTSPRTELGRIIFGILYGLSVVALFALLGRLGVPTFYDKLLPVPILNLMIRGLDRAARSNLLKRFDPGALGRGLTPRRRNLAYTSVWAAIFVVVQLLAGTRLTLARADSLLTQGRVEEAIDQYRDFVRSAPSQFDGHNKLGYALMKMGRSQEALAAIRRAIELQPRNPEVHNNLGLALMQAGQNEDAVASLRRAVELNPDYSEARYNLAHALTAVGRPGEAVVQFREALRVRPDWTPAMASLAWLEATEADALRDPADAVRLASRAADLTAQRDAQVLDVLAAAYAAAGRFADATHTAEMAQALAARSAPDLAAQITARLSLYRAGQPIVATGR
jgi:Flp pilus assembly protein TadD